MKLGSKQTLLGILTILSILVNSQQAQAGQLDSSTGWNYSIESSGNGSGANSSDRSYDITGIAFQQTADNILVALNAGMPIGGNTYNNTNIGWGDLFLNFTGNDFQTASNSQSLFGIRFAGTNSSGASSIGVYQNVQAKSVTSTHYGYNSLQQYFSEGYGKNTTEGTDLSTQQAVANYYGNNGNNPILNVISSGSKVGDISLLSAADLTASGLNFGKFNANSPQTFGFEFSKSLLPAGDFITNLLLECGNDGIALRGSVNAGSTSSKSVPEPTGVAGMALAVLSFAGLKRRRRSQVSI